MTDPFFAAQARRQQPPGLQRPPAADYLRDLHMQYGAGKHLPRTAPNFDASLDHRRRELNYYNKIKDDAASQRQQFDAIVPKVLGAFQGFEEVNAKLHRENAELKARVSKLESENDDHLRRKREPGSAAQKGRVEFASDTPAGTDARGGERIEELHPPDSTGPGEGDAGAGRVQGGVDPGGDLLESAEQAAC